MKNIIKIVILATGLSLTSCFNKEKPNYQYTANTDMYFPVGYETYQEIPEGNTAFKRNMEAQLPPEHTIKQGWMPFLFDNTNEGYELAKATLRNPLMADSLALKQNLQEGAALFNIYCMVCHGSEGDGQGILVKRDKFLGVPNYKNINITQGSIYHTIYYGKNAMGSFASQITEKERWQIAMYVEQLREKLIK
jgi:cytochrome c family protein